MTLLEHYECALALRQARKVLRWALACYQRKLGDLRKSWTRMNARVDRQLDQMQVLFAREYPDQSSPYSMLPSVLAGRSLLVAAAAEAAEAVS